VTPLMVISMVVAFCGVGLAYLLHCSDRRAAERLASRSPLLVKVLDARYWVDEAYQAVIVEPLRKLGDLLFTGDRAILDRLVDVVGYIPAFAAMILKPLTQRGSLQGYGLWMLAGAAAVLLLIFL
jgi:NADH-quinone oxidoreductase subunit L